MGLCYIGFLYIINLLVLFDYHFMVYREEEWFRVGSWGYGVSLVILVVLNVDKMGFIGYFIKVW